MEVTLRPMVFNNRPVEEAAKGHSVSVLVLLLLLL